MTLMFWFFKVIVFCSNPISVHGSGDAKLHVTCRNVTFTSQKARTNVRSAKVALWLLCVGFA